MGEMDEETAIARDERAKLMAVPCRFCGAEVGRLCRSRTTGVENSDPFKSHSIRRRDSGLATMSGAQLIRAVGGKVRKRSRR